MRLSSRHRATALRPALPRPGLAGLHDRLGPAADVQLAEDAADVVAHRLRADEKRLGDLVVAEALCHEVEHFALAGRRLTKAIRLRGRPASPARKPWSTDTNCSPAGQMGLSPSSSRCVTQLATRTKGGPDPAVA